MRLRLPLLCSLLLTITLAALYACGGSSTPTATADPESGESIASTQAIVITFSDAMDKDSLEIGGTMADQTEGGTWSTENKTDDTLTITPSSGWNSGEDRTLVINVSSSGGKELEELELTYDVTVTFSKFQKASVVIGQEDFEETESNQGGLSPSAKTINSPYGNPFVSDGKLFLPDYSNARTLIFNEIPTENNKAANVVMGQPDFTTNSSGSGEDDKFNGPEPVQVYQDKLYQLDYSDNRLLIFNTIPTSNGASADKVVGQDGFGTNDSDCTSSTFDGPESFIIADDKLFVADSNNHRVLIFNTIPTTNGESADVVLGQNSFTKCTENDDNQDESVDTAPSKRTLYYPTGIWTDGTKLIVADSDNNRVLIWNTIPTTNFKAADIVLGQNSFTKNTENDDNQDGLADSEASARTFDFPYMGLTSNGTQLFLGDANNNRVLIWNAIPTTNFKAADIVLGQNSFSKIASNDDNQDGASDSNASDRTLNYPTGLALAGNKLIVGDNSNNRFLIFEGQ